VPDDRRSRSSGYPPLGGSDPAGPVRRRPPVSSVGDMAHIDNSDDLFADLDLFLRESDREDPILREVRKELPAPVEQINTQILAGLVSP
jgi:hypothetical protein